MKIAHVAPLSLPVPPPRYGGIERIIYSLAVGSAKMGHKVTIYAANGSSFPASLPITVRPLSSPTLHLPPAAHRAAEEQEFQQVIWEQRQYDVIHFHYEPIIGEFSHDDHAHNYFNDLTVPSLSTFHNTTHITDHIVYYRHHPELFAHTYPVFISQNQAQALDFLEQKSVLYNGIDISKYTYSESADNYLLFVGRITPKKGIEEAIQIAQKTNYPLRIIAHLADEDHDFYQEKIQPQLSETIIYLGELSNDELHHHYQQAKALLFPLQWDEPFGLVMVEAMACGTPVIAYDRGSVSEIVENEKTGWVVSAGDEGAMREAVDQLFHLSENDYQNMRHQNRERVELKFTDQHMVLGYEKLYDELWKNQEGQ